MTFLPSREYLIKTGEVLNREKMKKMMNKLLKTNYCKGHKKFWCEGIGRRFQRVPYEFWMEKGTFAKSKS